MDYTEEEIRAACSVWASNAASMSDVIMKRLKENRKNAKTITEMNMPSSMTVHLVSDHGYNAATIPSWEVHHKHGIVHLRGQFAEGKEHCHPEA